jgi:hypothetical protein
MCLVRGEELVGDFLRGLERRGVLASASPRPVWVEVTFTEG